MPVTNEFWEENPLKKLAQAVPFENPGMYLIALREHVGRGKKALGDLVDTVADALPSTPRFFAGPSAPAPARLDSTTESE